MGHRNSSSLVRSASLNKDGDETFRVSRHSLTSSPGGNSFRRQDNIYRKSKAVDQKDFSTLKVLKDQIWSKKMIIFIVIFSLLMIIDLFFQNIIDNKFNNVVVAIQDYLFPKDKQS